MKVLTEALRLYSCIFALIFGLFLTGVASVLLISGATNFRFDMLPYWKGSSAVFVLFGLGLAGVISGALGLVQKSKVLLVLYSLVAASGLVYGYFISPVYRFGGSADAKNVLWLTLAAVIAFLGSLMQFRKPARA